MNTGRVATSSVAFSTSQSLPPASLTLFPSRRRAALIASFARLMASRLTGSVTARVPPVVDTELVRLGVNVKIGLKGLDVDGFAVCLLELLDLAREVVAKVLVEDLISAEASPAVRTWPSAGTGNGEREALDRDAVDIVDSD